MPVFLKLAEPPSYGAETGYDSRIFSGKRKVLRAQDSIGSSLHYAVIVSTTKSRAQRSVAPIRRGLGNQKMEDGVVCG